MTSLWRSSAAITALLVGALVTTSAPASAGAGAGAGETGCPVGFETLFVSELLTRGYSLAFVTLIDANVDGVMCGKPLNAVQYAKFCEPRGGCTVDVLYGARDNDVAGR